MWKTSKRSRRGVPKKLELSPNGKDCGPKEKTGEVADNECREGREVPEAKK